MRLFVAVALAGLVLAAGPAPAAADDCRVMELDFTPADDLQIVVWLEDTSGNYQGTVFLTQLTGIYGIGNRPGMMEFNSAWAWPYGRRTTTFPVWAERHGEEFPTLVFQNNDDTNLSHPLPMSSREPFFCRPLRTTDSAWDTETCASIVYTDKGMYDFTTMSKYPPRIDHNYVPGTDSQDVQSFEQYNPFDAVSRATPPGGLPHTIVFAIPDHITDGDYVAWAEANREFDQNEFYDFPSPTGIPWSEYGLAYRGQPSVVYRVPFTVGPTAPEVAYTESYFGYGDPDGLDGNIREPDGTITTDVDGSGASRLLLTVGEDETYRFRVRIRPNDDALEPGVPGDFTAVDVAADQVSATFIAPGNDDMIGTVAGYEIKYRAGTPITDENFEQPDMVAVASVLPEEPGTEQVVSFRNLQPNTNYYFGVRAYDECLNKGPIAVLHTRTPARESGDVDACFIATAAYGSVMQADVASLRALRDVALRSNAAGELLVTGYYTFGPALASVIRPSETLRELVRATLRPAVDVARAVTAVPAIRALFRIAGR